MTLLSDGKVLPTMIIFRGLKNVPKGKFPKDMVVCASMSGVMTGEMMVDDYIPKVCALCNI